MVDDILGLLQGLDDSSENEIIRAPFAYPGCKNQSIQFLLNVLPYRKIYVEPFGGSGVVLLNRRPSKIEVYNDRYGGVVSFFRCLRDSYEELVDRLDLTVHSREEFIWCKETWDHDVNNDVERAARWYYMVVNSYNGLGRYFARATKSASQFGRNLKNNLKRFSVLHNRLRNVQIENLDWPQVLKDYDSEDSVFYLDPPYYDVINMYESKFNKNHHIELCERIQHSHGFFALSGYDAEDHPYNKYMWDQKLKWKIFQKSDGYAQRETEKRTTVEETLWIKY